MPVFASGHFRIIWGLLFEAAHRYDDNLEDKEITLISPWFTDVTTAQSGWSEECMSAAFQQMHNLESLSQVLRQLVKIGYDVKVLTAAGEHKWLEKSEDAYLEREVIFMEKLSRPVDLTGRSVQCFRRGGLHKKFVKTPFGIMGGSTNTTMNGLAGRILDASTLFFKEYDEDNYGDVARQCISEFRGARAYGDESVPITDYRAPFDQLARNAEVEVDLSSVAPPVLITEELRMNVDEMPPEVPSGYVPPGWLQAAPRDDVETKSFFGQLATLTNSTAEYTIATLSHEAKEGYRSAEISEKIYPRGDDDSEDDDCSLLASLEALSEILLPTSERSTNFVKQQVENNTDYNYTVWHSIVSELLSGIATLSGLSEDSEISTENVATINRLHHLLFRGLKYSVS